MLMKSYLKKIKIAVLMILVIAIVGSVLPSCKHADPGTPAAEIEEESGPRYIAHRGYSHRYFPNTEEAFRAAAGMGFYGIETDIRKTKDGYYVCNHDASVVYADGSERKISATNRSILTEKPLKNDQTAAEAYLCTFEAYLHACKEGNKVAIIELKDWFVRAEILRILEIIDAEYDREKVCFISFIYAPLRLVREEDPSIELQYLSQPENDSCFANCIEDGINVSVRTTILTEALVKTIHDAGLKVGVWTVNTAVDLEVSLRLGVDYITSDVYSGE